MSGYKSYCDIGNVKSGEYDFVLKPDNPRESNVGLLLFHGAGHPYAAHDVTHPAAITLAGLIASAGIPVVTAEFDGDAWGNPDVMDLGDLAVARMNEICGTRTDLVLVAGGSMGGYTSLRYAMENPSKVAAVAGFVPLTNMTYFYPNLGAGEEIADKWGVTYPAALPAASQVQENAANFDMPIKLWYSGSDAVIRPVDTTNFAAAAPDCVAVNVGTNGHSDLTLKDVVEYGDGHGSDVINFLKANGA